MVRDRPLVVNVGFDECNCQVREVAQGVARAVPGNDGHFQREPGPGPALLPREIRPLSDLASEHLPLVTFAATAEIQDALGEMGFFTVPTPGRGG